MSGIWIFGGKIFNLNKIKKFLFFFIFFFFFFTNDYSIHTPNILELIIWKIPQLKEMK